jgi:hypothetical protein
MLEGVMLPGTSEVRNGIPTTHEGEKGSAQVSFGEITFSFIVS